MILQRNTIHYKLSIIKGIGKDLAITLWKDGAIVYALSRNEDNLKTLANDHPGIRTIKCDLSNWKETEQCLEGLEPVDHLVNNAGVAVKQPLSETTEEVVDT